MKTLLDTNFLLRLGDKGHAMHGIAAAAAGALYPNGCEGVLVPQVLYEYWVVATRPIAVNGLGMDPVTVDGAISKWVALYPLLRDERRVFDFWRELVNAHSVKGKKAHDARLVAAMLRHRIPNILTFNGPDFVRFANVNIYSPEDVIARRLSLDS